MSCCPLCCDDWIGTVAKKGKGATKDLVKCVCTYCDYAVCEGCMKIYVLSSSNDPRCMNPDCGNGWTVDHLYNMLPGSFIKGTYKKKREDILYERETAMMQGTQPFVENLIRKEILMVEIQEKLAIMKQVRQEIHDLETEALNLGRHNVTGTKERASKAMYTGRCSSGDCKGYVCANEFKCGLCSIKYCRKCMCVDDSDELKGHKHVHEHECKPDDVATFQLLKKDTKPCPACATPIFRTEGCSQMFCTQCSVVWDWNTLLIEENENHMHNPYYYTWRAAGGVHGTGGMRGAGAGACRDNNLVIRLTDVETAVLYMKKADEKTHTINVFRALNHINMVEMRRVSQPAVLPFEKNKDLRIKYLRNEVDDKRFKSMIQIREKAGNKKKEIWQILSAFHLAGQDVLGDLVRQRKPIHKDFHDKFTQLLDYSVEALAGVAKRYDCKVPNLIEICAKSTV
jgi:hypothetical protein